jgi:hypothetical protein
LLSIFDESVQQTHLADAFKKNNPLLISLCHFFNERVFTSSQTLSFAVILRDVLRDVLHGVFAIFSTVHTAFAAAA